MNQMEQLELLRAAIAVAVADGDLRRSEKGVLRGLADRIGVGGATFDAMVEAAEQDPNFIDGLMLKSSESAGRSIELLVAQARIDGEISQHEREVIARIAADMKISDDEFQRAYEAGIKRADRIRNRRTTA